MIRLGEVQKLKVIKTVDFGVYLAESEESADEKVLLPKAQLPEGCKCGDEIEVFIYRDSQDRLISTVRSPLITLGKVAALKVVSVGKQGAFLDWGLEKDLFLPYAQQNRKLSAGDEVLVYLYIDKSDRLCASMKVYDHLRTDSPYKAGDDVSGLVFQENENYGMFVAVDDIYCAAILKQELYKDVKPGDRIRARVSRVREDGRLNLSVRDKAHVQIYPDMECILKLLEDYGGVLPFTEKATPEVIKRETGMSKNEFKRAVGHLYKERKISIEDGRIRLLNDEQ
ncbi:MAG: RNA-binding protein [Lachnospiraceae bacterium]|nr:RNA-binding protein [Lachnospiraceae bacterium]